MKSAIKNTPVDSKCSICGAILVSVSLICLTALLIADTYKDAQATCPSPLQAGDYYTPEE